MKSVNDPVRVLLVDDDEEDYMIASDLFEDIEHGTYTLDWVDDYEVALEVIERREHDVYLFDYHLGGRDGLELLKDTLARGVRAPVIMLTGQGGRQVDVKAMEFGAYDYLVKGHITPQVLERALRYAMQHAESTEALRATVRISSALLSVVNRIDRSIFIIDPLTEGDPIIFVNEGFIDMTGHTRSDVLGRDLGVLEGPETLPDLARRALELAWQREPLQENTSLLYADGSSRPCELFVYPVCDAEGELIQVIGMFRQLDD